MGSHDGSDGRSGGAKRSGWTSFSPAPWSSRRPCSSADISTSSSAPEGCATGSYSTKRSTVEGDMGPEAFINRELSWLEFNRRVLEEAKDPSVPLRGRGKFLSIFSTNLERFLMVRAAERK